MDTRDHSRTGTYRINLKLDPRDDADIIAWLEGYRSGQRSNAVREAIRRGLGIASPVEPALDLEAIRQVIADELSRSLAGLSFHNQINQEHSSAGDAESRYGPKLDRMLDSLLKSNSDANESPS